jgi:hypothetical protein
MIGREINFEFNSYILSDGYPSLLRIAELLNRNQDYRVRVEGHTVGSDRTHLMTNWGPTELTQSDNSWRNTGRARAV